MAFKSLFSNNTKDSLSNDNNYQRWYGGANKIANNALSGYSNWSSGGGTPWGAIGGAAKAGYNMISGHNDKDYSDLEESIIYPIQGASKGAAFGPWGALGGALYGLGYSFKDDLGLDDNNFFTQLLFPLGMGDGGGLKINNQPVLDIL